MLNSLVEAQVIPREGIFHGGGQTITIDVFVRGPQGTPYFVRSSIAGLLETYRSNGTGGVSAFFEPGGYVLDGVGSRAIEVINGYSCGVSGAQHPPDGNPEYTLATSFTASFLGRMTFIFNPFGGTTPFQCQSMCSATGELVAGVGHCAGDFETIVNGPVGESLPNGGTHAYYHIENRIRSLGLSGCDCSCCEFRQLARSCVFLGTDPNHMYSVPQRNADNQEFRCLEGEFHEDSTCIRFDDGNCAPTTITRYGHRSDPDNMPGRDGYLRPDGTRDRAAGCEYYAIDTPGYPANPDVHYCLLFEFRQVLIDHCLVPPQVIRDQTITRCLSGVGGSQPSESCDCSVAANTPRAGGTTIVNGRRVNYNAGYRGADVVYVALTVSRTAEDAPPAPGDFDVELGLARLPQFDLPVGQIVLPSDESVAYQSFSFQRPDQPLGLVETPIRILGVTEIIPIQFGGLEQLRADMNCDGRVNNFDIDGFVLALSDPASYSANYPDCNVLNADANGDDVVNNFDIDSFVACVANGGCP
ncbi:MAG: hypothetical protein JNG88_12770 [Phycisphaerales bacterium]|nr:hypothetical protein [Phycisphaerales bacterium]